MKSFGIIGTGAYLPERVVLNKDLPEALDTSDAWIMGKTGIHQRHIADDAEATSDLALHAARRALESARVRAEELDLIIVATSSPDMLQPSTAAILQGKLGALNAGAFDVGAVCAGFTYALAVALAMMRGADHYRHVLVVGAETYSRILDWTDRTTCVFFGDGAGAVVLGETLSPGYLSHHLGADGRYWDVIQFPAGGSRMPASQATLDNRMHAFRMQGKKVWDFAIHAFPDAVRKVAETAGVAVESIDWIISHQANINIIRASMASLGLPMSRTHTTIANTANTSGASIPIALDDGVRSGRIQPGQLVCMVGFGGGLAWGSVLVRWVAQGSRG